MWHNVKNKLHSHVKSRGSANITGRVTGTSEEEKKQRSKVNGRQNIEQRRTNSFY
jgi:hypothetical protein